MQPIGIYMIILNTVLFLAHDNPDQIIPIPNADWQAKTPTTQRCSQNQGAGLEAHLKYQREKERAVKTGEKERAVKTVAEEGMWTAWETQSSIWSSSWSLQVCMT